MNIPLGFEIRTGRRISVPLGHLVVTGQTQKSGKTTTLEAMITRSGLRAVAFITKRGEKSFRLMTPIKPYFRERADWQFVQALLEASMTQKMDYKQAWIMRACEGAATLGEVQANIQKFIKGEKHVKLGRGGKRKETWIRKPATGLNGDMYYVLNNYFEEVLPQVAKLNATDKLVLRKGVNVMDLSPYSFPMQALVIRSVLEWVYLKESNVIVIIPEAWEFIPRQRRSPVRMAAEELIRKGAAEKNYIWLDSQDIAGVARELLRQMQVWILGVQRDAYEIQRTLDAIPDLGARPKPEDVATLGKGEFLVAHDQSIAKVYVQPAGMEDAHAQAIAVGDESPDSWRAIVRTLDDGIQAAELEAEGSDTSLAERSAEGSTGSVPAGSEVPSSNGNTVHADRDGDEAMWKEKYEALAKERQTLIEAHDALAARIRTMELQWASPTALPQIEADTKPSAAPVGNGQPPYDESVYEYIKRRLLAEPDHSVLLKLLQNRPELNVKINRVTLTASDETLQGKLAMLIADGFFAAARPARAIMDECFRRGWLGRKTPLNFLDKKQACGGLVELGFLTQEADGYRAVPGMKVTRA